LLDNSVSQGKPLAALGCRSYLGSRRGMGLRRDEISVAESKRARIQIEIWIERARERDREDSGREFRGDAEKWMGTDRPCKAE